MFAPLSTLIADGMACRVSDDQSLEVIIRDVDHIVRIREEEVRGAMKAYFTDTHNVVEGVGAAGLAAALKEKHALRGKRVGLVGNRRKCRHRYLCRSPQQ